MPTRQAEPEQAGNPEGGLTDGVESESDHSGRGTNDLTAREQEVLERVCLGESNKMIARKLGMTEATVKVYVGHLMRKFRASNRTQLLARSLNLDNLSTERSVEQAAQAAEHGERTLRLITPSRARREFNR